MRALFATLYGAMLVAGCSLGSVTFTPDNAGQPNGGPTTAIVTITVGGAATGSVAAQGLPLSCAKTCTATVAIGTAVTLVATPDPGAVFGGWSGGGCAGTDAACTVAVTEDLAIAARFDVATFTVDVGLTGNGGGTVTSSPAGISCGADCAARFAPGAVVTLSAVAAGDSTFTGWSGAGCAGTATCQVTMTQAALVTASFALKQFVLTVGKTGTGGGTVTSSPAGISCGTDCSEAYDAHTVVTLTAAAAADSVFLSWSGGGCSGTGTCAVTMNSTTLVTASFVLRQFVLTVAVAGGGSGTVTSSPAGISCNPDCSEAYDAGTLVTLVETPASGSTFAGWSGACSGTGACQVTMTAASSVTATFSPVNGRIAVANFNGPPSVEIFPAGATGNVAPLTLIVGPVTTFNTLRGITVADNEIIVVDGSAPAIDVFPLSATGNVAPARRITGSATGLANPLGVAVSGGEIYVGQDLSGGILVFPQGANGNVAPSRTITGIGGSSYPTVVAGEIYTTDRTGKRILVFPASSSGVAVPTRIIAGPSTGLQSPLAILVQGGEIFISENNSSAIRVFPQTGNGDVPPLRVIGGSNSQFGIPEQMAILAGELYVANFATRSVLVFPVNANGNVAPGRQITGPATQLTGPLGAWIF
jgi:hypothetical protein